MLRILALALALALPAAASASTLYHAHAHAPNKHAVWVPALATDLHFDPHGTFKKTDDLWTIEGNLYSKSDPTKTFHLYAEFTNILSAADYKDEHGALKGANWSEQKDDWMFAETVTGTLKATHGTFDTYDISRHPGAHDYWAQLGTGLNDKNDHYGLSSWFRLTKDGWGANQYYRGDFNFNLERPVPEPSAALVFAAGLFIASQARRRNRK